MCATTPRGATPLPSTDRAPGLARAFVTDFLCRHHCADVLDDALLVTTEAVTNAVLHGVAPIDLTVECLDALVEIRVHDASGTRPRLVDAAESDQHGRGVTLIDALADSWGVDEEQGDGKDVWFRLTAAAPTPV